MPKTRGRTRLGVRCRSSTRCQNRVPKHQWNPTPTTTTPPRTRSSSPFSSAPPWRFQWLWWFLWWLEPPTSSCFASIATAPFSTSRAAWLGICQQMNKLLINLPSQNPKNSNPWITYLIQPRPIRRRLEHVLLFLLIIIIIITGISCLQSV